jgi:glucosamine--fructose-6-phosphate aminotransferase (isomerizing)
VNAHPHQVGSVAVVHNGIIENFKELRAELNALGLIHETDTDTETVALLTHYYMSQGHSPTKAAQETITRLEGAFALAFLFQGNDDLMIAARKGSPLAIGHGDGEAYVGSDAIALAPLTDKITYLEEGDFAVITRTTTEIYDENGALANRETRRIAIDAQRVDKGGYKHFHGERDCRTTVGPQNHPEPLSKRGCLRAGIART